MVFTQVLPLGLIFKEAELKSIKRGCIFVGKTQNSFLFGPKINSKFCSMCFKKRLLSSSFFDFKNYHKVSAEDINIIKKTIYKINKLLLADNTKVLEIDKNTFKMIRTHYILPVPGCLHLRIDE